MQQTVILAQEEWAAVVEVLDVIRRFNADSQAGTLKGAINREIASGQKLAALLTELGERYKAVPAGVRADAL